MTDRTASIPFLGAAGGFDDADILLFGCPFDGTASYRKGARDGPAGIRKASDSIETYSPLLDADLENIRFADLGDLSLPEGGAGPESGAGPEGGAGPVLARIGEEARRILIAEKTPFALGGEHLISLPLIEAALGPYPDLVVFQWDAHADLRESYEGAALSHATVMRRVVEKIGDARLFQFGIRSGTRGEWAWMRERATCRPLTPEAVMEVLSAHAGAPVYLTLDLDVLDPGEFPGTGNPEAGGVRFSELAACIGALKLNQAPVVALDVVEFSPPCDPSGASAVAAAKVVRELLLSLPVRKR